MGHFKPSLKARNSSCPPQVDVDRTLFTYSSNVAGCLEKVVTFLRMPSQTPIRTRKGAFDPTRKKGGGSLPPLTPLLISQTRMANGKTDLLFAICLGPGPGDKILN